MKTISSGALVLLLLAIYGLIFAGGVSAGEKTKDTQITFIQSFAIDSDTLVVTPVLRDFSETVDSIMRVDTIEQVNIVGLASIDGPEELNQRLALDRAKALRKWLVRTTQVPQEIISVSALGEDWTLFRQLVEKDDKIPAFQNLMVILNSRISNLEQKNKIKMLDDGSTWRYLSEHIFPLMRSAEVTMNVKHRYIVPEEKKPVEEQKVVEEVIEVNVKESGEEQYEGLFEEEWRKKMYIKTDLPYWLMTWSNLAIEVDLAKHWSFNLPIYYSAINYFKNDIKFRTFSFQPGLRYWFKPDNMGAYMEAHYGMGWWNFAFGGEYRYQDWLRQSPAMGGGVAAGYRIFVTKNHHWIMEFGAGVGYYHLKYDRFQNRPNGKLIDSRSKNVFFLDNINVSIGYSFPIQKKKGGGK